MKIRPLGGGLLHADGRTDGESHDGAFRNFANFLKNGRLYFAEKLQEFGLYKQ
jgi:hypothetical protein